MVILFCLKELKPNLLQSPFKCARSIKLSQIQSLITMSNSMNGQNKGLVINQTYCVQNIFFFCHLHGTISFSRFPQFSEGCCLMNRSWQEVGILLALLSHFLLDLKMRSFTPVSDLCQRCSMWTMFLIILPHSFTFNHTHNHLRQESQMSV